MTIRIRNTLSEISAGAGRFGDIVRGSADKQMAEAGRATLLAADQNVHVITDSLRQSGSVEVEQKTNGVKVIVEFGGPSGGPNDPVDYAIYEYGRGGDHDFMTPAIDDTRDLYTKGIKTTLTDAFRKAF